MRDEIGEEYDVMGISLGVLKGEVGKGGNGR